MRHIIHIHIDTKIPHLPLFTCKFHRDSNKIRRKKNSRQASEECNNLHHAPLNSPIRHPPKPQDDERRKLRVHTHTHTHARTRARSTVEGVSRGACRIFPRQKGDHAVSNYLLRPGRWEIQAGEMGNSEIISAMIKSGGII